VEEFMRTRTRFGRLAGFTLRHRRLVMLGWLVVFIAGVVASGQLANRLSADFSLPGQPGYETAKAIQAKFGANSAFQAPSLVVVTGPNANSARADAQAIGAAFESLRGAAPGARVIDFANTGSERFITDDGRSTFAMVFLPPTDGFGADPVTALAKDEVAKQLPGYDVGVTGINQLAASKGGGGTGVLGETLIGAAGALVVLAFVFASFLALVPLLVAAVSILATLLMVLAVSYVSDVSFIVQFLVALVGLGIAIDYSLLLVTRWREERAAGRSNHEAVVRAVETAGRTIAVSGLTVAIGLVALIVLPVPGLRSVGVGGILIPVVSVAVTLTLLPALLGGIGPRVDWPRVRHEERRSRGWSRWSALMVQGRWPAVAIGAAILALFIVPVFSITVGSTSTKALARSGPAYATYQLLRDGGVPGGALTPLEILTRESAAPEVMQRLSQVPGIATVALPNGPVGHRDGYADILALPAQETLNTETLSAVRATQHAVVSMPDVVGVAGVGPEQQDYSRAVFGNFPLMFSLIALVTFLLLVRAFRSVLLAVKAVVLNLVSLAATFGILTWFWQEGHGSQALFGIPATGAIPFWIPLMVFAFLFGLSMDYEVFILSRVREEYDRSGSTNAAIVEGLSRTGRLVTCAALILFLAFASLASASSTDLKIMATGLGVGILLDATVVRALLVPALVAAMGRWNWWAPAWLARLLRFDRHTPPAVSSASGRGVDVSAGSRS
jgi:RND superfamily putative drug exporter